MSNIDIGPGLAVISNGQHNYVGAASLVMAPNDSWFKYREDVVAVHPTEGCRLLQGVPAWRNAVIPVCPEGLMMLSIITVPSRFGKFWSKVKSWWGTW